MSVKCRAGPLQAATHSVVLSVGAFPHLSQVLLRPVDILGKGRVPKRLAPLLQFMPLHTGNGAPKTSRFSMTSLSLPGAYMSALSVLWF